MPPQSSKVEHLINQSPNISCLHPDYSHHLSAALEEAAPAFEDNGLFSQFCASLEHTDLKLESLQISLTSLVKSLEHSCHSLITSSHADQNFRSRLHILQHVTEYLSTFTQQVHVPHHLASVIEDANPHSTQFKLALNLLSEKYAILQQPSIRNTPSSKQTMLSLEKTRTVAIRRIYERLTESLHLLKTPSTSFIILRQALLFDQSSIITFLAHHNPNTFNKIADDYACLAAKHLSDDMHQYSSLFYSKSTAASNYPSAFGLTAVADSSSHIFSTLFVETNETYDTNSPCSMRLPHIESTNVKEHQVLMEKCSTAIQSPEMQPVTKSDIWLQKDNFSSTLDDSFRNCTTYFLRQVENETIFLTKTFGDAAHRLLDKIYHDKSTALLSMLQTEITVGKHQPSYLDLLLLTLFTCRNIRTALSTSRKLDCRMWYLVQAEKIIQTSFLEELDSRVDDLKTVPPFTGQDIDNIHECKNWILQHVTWLQNILLITAMCEGNSQAADIIDIIQRRLVHFIEKLACMFENAVDTVVSHAIKNDMRLNWITCLLVAIEPPDHFSSETIIYNAVRKPALHFFENVTQKIGQMVIDNNAG